MNIPWRHRPLLTTPTIFEARANSYVSSKVGAFDDVPAMDERVPDDDTQASGSGSFVSGLTELENETDDFGRVLLQHAKDEHRLNSVMQNNGQPFRKARPHPRVALTLDNLERSNGARSAAAQVQRSGSVGSSDTSDPPVHIPREWGRKAKHSNDWLRRINADENQQEEVPEQQDDDIIYPHRTALTGDSSPHVVNWEAAAAEVPLPSIANTPPGSLRRLKRSTTPQSAEKRNTSLDHIREWELDQDFMEASLLTSTPAVPTRNRALDEIRQREIEIVKTKAVTTSRLDEIWEKVPEETPRRRSSSRKLATSQRNDADVPAETRARSPETGRRTRRSSNKENSPTSMLSKEGSPIVVYKSQETIGLVDRGIQADAKASLQRPNHRRQDSQALLRQLARVTSATPSPSPAKDMFDSRRPASPSEVKLRRQQSNGSPEDLPKSAGSSNSNYISQKSPAKQGMGGRQISINAPEVAAYQETERPQKSKSDKPAASTDQKDQQSKVDRPTPSPEEELLSAKTPVVMGAWVDTPRPSIARSSSDPTSPAIVRDFGLDWRSDSHQQSTRLPKASGDQESNQRATKSRSPQLSSALAAVVEEARTRQRGNSGASADDTLGESTIDSLEDIINPALDDPSYTLDLGDLKDQNPSEDGAIRFRRPFTQAERDRRQELLALDNMNARLRAARTSIRDASRGMKRVEREVDAADEVHDTDIGSHNVNSVAPCTRCGCTGGAFRHGQGSVFGALWTEFRSLFYTWDNTNPGYGILNKVGLGRLRFTWLGLFWLMFWSWLFSETTLCKMYCQPLYAKTMVGTGVNPDAPEFPYVIPTLLFRPFGWLWRPLLSVLGSVCGALYHFFVGKEWEPYTCYEYPEGYGPIGASFAYYEYCYGKRNAGVTGRWRESRDEDFVRKRDESQSGAGSWTATVDSFAKQAFARETITADFAATVGRMADDEYL
ncbi:hypothetical protein B0A49_04167 [Cryomyces minteri]|uniref:Uncharacterized protein n=1 Tax=Cryomyces minteri TaxID=331657 RepID=A0A4U0X4B3_9PEZI|nr:hypothetical protein B0A49_04167 [Cryomyces minteri]